MADIIDGDKAQFAENRRRGGGRGRGNGMGRGKGKGRGRSLTKRSEDGTFAPLGLPIRHMAVDNLCYVGSCTEENVRNRNLFTPRVTDCLVATYPRSGTTWTLEIIRNIHLVQSPGLEDGHPLRLIDHTASAPWININPNFTCIGLDEKPGPRIMKTHNHYQHLNVPLGNTEFKIIHVMRDPRDVFCSAYTHISEAVNFGYEGTFEEYVEYFLQGKVESGCYWEYNKQYLENKEGFNILYLKYEELTNDKINSIKKISNFLGYADISPEQIELVNKATEFEAMKGTQRPVNGSVEGRMGRYKDKLNANQILKIDEITSVEFLDIKDKVPMSYFNAGITN